MHIKSIVIDGFKSYGSKVEINNFDPQFNAITGPNGSGKSNILDSICFVLGLSNTRDIRAESLLDLIYKNGRAGVTKATVTLIFDNNVNPHPFFKDKREFTVARQILSQSGIKSQYLVNGYVVPNRYVTDIFNAVHLNVNNPHFLVMQGRIVKVLNMNPAQIVGLVEEAVGTRAYYSKKLIAERTIARKEPKLNELNKVLEENVSPLIQRINEERNQYHELQRLEREYSKSEKKHIAYIYSRIKTKESKVNGELQNAVEQTNNLNNMITDLQDTVTNLETEIVKKNEILDAQRGSKLQNIKGLLTKAEDEAAKLAGNIKVAKDDVSKLSDDIKLTEKQINDYKTAHKKQEETVTETTKLYERLKEEEANFTTAIKCAEKRYSSIRAGQIVELEPGSDTRSLREKKLDIQKELSDCAEKKEICERQLNADRNKLKSTRSRLNELKTAISKEQKRADELNSRIENCKTNIAKLQFDENRLVDLKQQKVDLESDISKFIHLLRNPKYSRFQLNYKIPHRNFRPESVKGVACSLFRSIDSKYNTALQAAAGGRLYNVVVDDESISRSLINNGNLTRRVTFIPLKQIMSHVIRNSVVQRAKAIGGENGVFPALSLIKYDKEYQPAMQYLFGGTLICTNDKMITKIAFDREVRTRCVSLEGDIVDPGGEQIGGYSVKVATAMDLYEEYDNLNRQLHEMKSRLEHIDSEIHSLTQLEQRYVPLKNQLEKDEYQLNLMNNQFQMKECVNLEEEIKTLQRNIETLPLEIQECIKKEREGTQKLSEIEDKINKTFLDNEAIIAAAKNEISKLEAEKKTVDTKLKKINCDSLRERLAEIESEIDKRTSNVNLWKENIEAIREKIENMQREYDLKKDEVNKLSEEENMEKQSISNQSNEIQQLTLKKNEVNRNLADVKIKILEMNDKKKKIEEELANLTQQVAEYEHKYSWIVHERDLFGVADGVYNFRGYNLEAGSKELSSMKEKMEQLQRTTNIDLKNFHGNEEATYNDLLNKKEVIINDKNNLYATMSELDEHKNVALHKAWLKINKDFSSIFSHMLPGANAKLDTLPGKSVAEGLEIKVSLGGMWKKSLNELSGGQRSLVALSFILAMLLFNPAPIYILDEIDAALDLSHTQNIGTMIKQYFKFSQFIIVSLKEGMFSNANVLFRTQLRNGLSSVSRTAVSQ